MLILFLFICLGAGSLASWLTIRGVKEWYPQLRKPPGTPPSWVFGPVWTTLYVLMAMSAWLVWRDYGWRGGGSALLLFFAQLGLNMAWSGIFFGARLPGVAFAEIVILWLAILFNIVVFDWLTPMAALLASPVPVMGDLCELPELRNRRLNRPSL